MGKEYSLEAVNQRLKQGRVPVRLRNRKGRLELRATLPPKPESHRPRPFQQEISLRVPANVDGLRRAEKAALVLGAELIAGTFHWENYRAERLRPENKLISQWIKEFERFYRGKHALKEST